MRRETVGSPFLWRHLAVLLLIAANFAFSVLVAYKARRGFRASALASSVALRVGSVLYATVSLLALLVALSLFSTVEIGADAEKCWRMNRKWAKVETGMTRGQVVALLGEPAEVHFGAHYFYDLHPLSQMRNGTISFEEATVQNDKLPDHAKVVSKNPQERVAWRPPGADSAFRDHVSQDAQAICFCALVVLALASLVPFRLDAGANSWMLYTPIAALTLAAVYEAYAGGSGWRFDLLLLGPAYLVIFGAWLLRLWAVLRR